MESKRRLNADIAGSISQLQSVAKEFELRIKLYRTLFRGKGLDFDGYRTYYPDDDSVNIDWKASTRANKILVKQYIEERDLKIFFVVDVSNNMVFGSTQKLKCEYAAEFIAAFTHLMMNSGDNVGYILFNDGIVNIIQPKKGQKQFDTLIDSLTTASNYGNKADFVNVLDFITDSFGKSINSLILVSDFIRVNKDLEDKFKLLGKKFETIAVMIKDPLDRTMPEVSGELVIEDGSSNEQILIDPSVAKKNYEKNALEQELIVEEILRGSNIDLLKLDTTDSFVFKLLEFLKERIIKRKGFR